MKDSIKTFAVITYNTGNNPLPAVIFTGTKDECSTYFIDNDGYRQGYEITEC